MYLMQGKFYNFNSIETNVFVFNGEKHVRHFKAKHTNQCSMIVSVI